eukprot:CFRG5642T1
MSINESSDSPDGFLNDINRHPHSYFEENDIFGVHDIIEDDNTRKPVGIHRSHSYASLKGDHKTTMLRSASNTELPGKSQNVLHHQKHAPTAALKMPTALKMRTNSFITRTQSPSHRAMQRPLSPSLSMRSISPSFNSSLHFHKKKCTVNLAEMELEELNLDDSAEMGKTSNNPDLNGSTDMFRIGKGDSETRRPSDTGTECGQKVLVERNDAIEGMSFGQLEFSTSSAPVNKTHSPVRMNSPLDTNNQRTIRLLSPAQVDIPSYGFAIQKHKNSVFIVCVQSASPAADAKLKIGDEVLVINNRRIGRMPISQIMSLIRNDYALTLTVKLQPVVRKYVVEKKAGTSVGISFKNGAVSQIIPQSLADHEHIPRHYHLIAINGHCTMGKKDEEVCAMISTSLHKVELEFICPEAYIDLFSLINVSRIGQINYY